MTRATSIVGILLMTLPCCQTQACAKLTAPFTITDADLMQYPTESMYLYRQSHPESACESNDGAMGLLALNLHAINQTWTIRAIFASPISC